MIMAKFVKQPAKVGDKIVVLGQQIPHGFTMYGVYTVVATANSQEKNRIVFGRAYPLAPSDRFSVFVIDDDGDKRHLYLGTNCFGMTVEKLPDEKD